MNTFLNLYAPCVSHGIYRLVQLLKPYKKILVIRRDNIGDLVCTTPALAALRRRFPEAEIGALVNSYNEDVINNNPNIDRVFVYMKLKHARNLFEWFGALWKKIVLVYRLRCWAPDVIILAKASYDPRALNFAYQIGAKHTIGFSSDLPFAVKMQPHTSVIPPKAHAMHEVEAINLLLSPLQISDGLGPLQVFPEESEKNIVLARLPPASYRVAVHVSAREVERRWGVQNFIALIEWLLQTKPERQVLLFWSPGPCDSRGHPGDDLMVKQILQNITHENLIPVPTMSLLRLVAALSLCDLFVGTDGGAMHLAAALDRPVVALFENCPDKINHWYPWHVPAKVIHGTGRAVSTIMLSDVKYGIASLEEELGLRESCGPISSISDYDVEYQSTK